MKSHPRLSQLLVETGAFKDLETPVILASGQLGIYYINAEKLAQDGGKFNEYGDSSKAMIEHAIRMTQEHPTFGEVIDILAHQVKRLTEQKHSIAVSGGQRRDWLFSGPIARKLKIPHISIYKNGRAEEVLSDGTTLPISSEGPLAYDFITHIVDLLTEGSSCYSSSNGVESGWIPEIRKRGGKIENLVAVVTRLQGGEENLAAQGINVHANVAIDQEFLWQHSKNPERAVQYNANPTNWSMSYLKDNGALALLDTFNPEGGKLDKAKNFMGKYGDYLREVHQFNPLNDACRTKYGKGVDEILA